MKLEDGHYSSPRWSWEILDCAMPMTFDTYSNCAHQCVYCFAFFQRAVGGAKDDYLHHRVKAVDVERVKRLFRLDAELLKSSRYEQFAWYIRKGHVLQWGGLSDGFDWYERKFRKSLELLRFFCEINYPISISTKGVWFLDDPEYVDVLRGAKNVHIKYSIITDNEEHASRLEAGTPPPEERLRALERLNELGIGATTLRFRPFVIGSSNLSMERLFRRAKDIGCYSVTTEFLCIEKRVTPNHLERYRRISEVVGYDVWNFYRQHSYSGSGLMRLNYEVKRPYIQQMQSLSEELKLPFYVSDAHHKEASAGAGCCGLPNTGVLGNYQRGQFAEAMQIAKRNGRVYWSDIAAEAEGLKQVPFTRAEGYNQGDTYARAKHQYHTMYDFMRDVWNNPKSWSSPARYFGGALVPSGLDDSGDIIYLYNRPFIEQGVKVESVAELSAILDQQQARRDDGGDLGHVAFPIYIRAEGATCRLLDAARLEYELETPNLDALARQDGLTAYWLLEPNMALDGYTNLRAALSAVEGGLIDAVRGAELVWVEED